MCIYLLLFLKCLLGLIEESDKALASVLVALERIGQIGLIC